MRPTSGSCRTPGQYDKHDWEWSIAERLKDLEMIVETFYKWVLPYPRTARWTWLRMVHSRAPERPRNDWWDLLRVGLAAPQDSTMNMIENGPLQSAWKTSKWLLRPSTSGSWRIPGQHDITTLSISLKRPRKEKRLLAHLSYPEWASRPKNCPKFNDNFLQPLVKDLPSYPKGTIHFLQIIEHWKKTCSPLPPETLTVSMLWVCAPNSFRHNFDRFSSYRICRQVVPDLGLVLVSWCFEPSQPRTITSRLRDFRRGGANERFW